MRPRMLLTFALACSTYLTAGPACAQDRAQFAPRIKAEVAAVDAQINEAEADDAKYSGGLIKAIIDARLATLKQTRAMLAQRAAAGDMNVTLRYTVNGKPFVEPAGSAEALTAVESELAELKLKLATAEQNAAQYSGGLVQAMALTTVETMRQSQAMLEQKRLALKFGLPQFLGFADANNPSAPAPAASSSTDRSSRGAASAPQSVSTKDWEIVSVDAKVTESNDTWWKYAWKLTMRNSGTVPHMFRATIEFQDSEGFIIDSDNSDPFVVQANSEDTATGYALVRVPGASKVARTVAKVVVVR